MADEVELLCYNKGCGKKFLEKDNFDGACVYHPGNPVFHDALKGWSCCPKKYRDFTDFLNIQGCCKGHHNPVKPPEPEHVKESPLEKDEVIVVRAPQPRVPEERPSDDLPCVVLRVKVGASVEPMLQKLKKQQEKEEEEAQQRKEDGDEIKIGTVCKNKGCNSEYMGTDSAVTECYYHPGFPIFHEGYKFWSCCQKRTSDFNEFLRQEGCRIGDHCWTEDEKKAVKCRYDWHQMGSLVVVTLYAKGCLPQSCLFEANPTNLRVCLVFEGGKCENELKWKLNGVIDPEKSTIDISGTKVEVKLRKASPVMWPCLELVEKRTAPKEEGSD